MMRRSDVACRVRFSAAVHGMRASACGETRRWNKNVRKAIHKCVTVLAMTGDEFYRKVRKLGEQNGIPVSFVGRHGKGSHGRLYYGNAFTTLKDRRKELGPGLLRKMCRDLEIDPDTL